MGHTRPVTQAHDAVVLAGGRGSRLGGADKPSVRVGGRTLLDRVLAACRDAATTVVVGPRRPCHRPVTWTRERPPGTGPLAAVDAGLRLVSQPVVVLLAADLPFLDRPTVHRLLDLPEGVDGAVLTDRDGRQQPLVAAYRTEPLRREIALLATEYGSLAGLPLRLLPAGLTLHRVPGGDAALDCDTRQDLAAARARIREHGAVLEEWITAVQTELGVDLEMDTAALLDVARDAAHAVARPAAPLTTFLVGYAAAQRGMPLHEAMRKVTELAARWNRE